MDDIFIFIFRRIVFGITMGAGFVASIASDDPSESE